MNIGLSGLWKLMTRFLKRLLQVRTTLLFVFAAYALATATAPSTPVEALRHGIPSAHASQFTVELQSHLAELGDTLSRHFERSRDFDILRSAIEAYQNALQFTPDDDPNKPIHWNNLGHCLVRLFQRFGKLDTLQSSLAAFRSAIKLTPGDDPKLALWLSNLATSLWTRFNRQGELKDLESALESYRRAVELTSADDPELPTRLNNLANSLQARFHRLGELKDLEIALETHRRATVELTSANDPELPMRLNNLANSLQARFHRLGELKDLESALESYRRAVELTSADDPELPTQLNNLANSLQARFHRLGELKDLESTLETRRRAVELTPGDDPRLPMQLSNLATSFQARFHRLGELKDLENALKRHHRAIESTPDDDPQLPRRFGHLAGSLWARFNRLGELKDLQSALETHRRAVELTPGDDPDLPRRLSNLADTWRTRFHHSRELKDLESALEAHHRAIGLTQDDDPRLPRRFSHLADFWRTRFSYDRTQQSFDAAVDGYMTATSQPLGDHVVRFYAANACIQMLSDHPEFSSSESLLLAYSRILDALPELVWLGHSVQRRFEESIRVGKLVNAAVSAAIEIGDRSRALEWLEAGRGLVWSQVASMRTPVDDLAEHLPDLARKLREVQHELQLSGFSDNLYDSGDVVALDERGPSFGFPTESTADRHRRATILYDDLVKEIRSHDGFEDFMRPKKLTSFTSSPAFASLSGPVVFLNAGKVCYDALMLSCTGEVRSVKLPELTQKRAETLHSVWTKFVGPCRAQRRGVVPPGQAIRGSTTLEGRVLGFLWKWAVFPVLQELRYTEDPSDRERPPHVIWCPTGPLMQLPLHAAGVYDIRESGPHVYDYVVSSYTPSLSALLRCYEGSTDSECHPDPRMLVVAVPETTRKGLSRLPGVRDETARLRSVMPGRTHTFLEDKQASAEAVLASLDEHAWIHLACHGSQNVQDPTKSAFQLYDDQLNLSTLMSKASMNAELAFLSACETAVGDPKIPEESVHLAAGMLAVGYKGVVATIWSIKDADAPVIVDAYYRRLLELRRSGRLKKGETGAAYALHDAVKCLREVVGENNFERWVPFVHFGA